LVAVTAEGQFVHLVVSDTGRGVLPNALPHIFGSFYKGRDSLDTGLGLVIAKQLVQAHAGSEVGVGIRISFTLPTQN
jgi:signal transduction histidine kinase